MRIFVVGGTGVIGRALVPALINAGHEVTVLIRESRARRDAPDVGATRVVGDVLDADTVLDAVVRAAPDAIVNQATALPDEFDARRLRAIYAANDRVRRESAANLLAAARAAGVRRLVTQSVAFWYAPDGESPRTEQAPWFQDAPEPIGTAVRTLRDVEHAVLSDPDVIGVALRYGHLYGPGTWYDRDGDIGRRVLKRRYPIVGSGDGISSFVHVEDAAAATLHALGDIPRGAYNVVDDEPARSREWLPAFAAALGGPPPRRVPAFLARLAVGGPLVRWMGVQPGASNASYRALGWTPTRPSWRRGFREVAQ